MTHIFNQVVCALGSLSFVGGIQNLIICVKMARSERLAESDYGDEFSLNEAVEISDLPSFSSRDVFKNKGYRIIGKNSVIPLISVFCSKSLACSRKSKNCCFVLCFSHESTKGKTRGSPGKMILSSD